MRGGWQKLRPGILTFVSLAALVNCTATLKNTASTPPGRAAHPAALWEEPADLERRDLFHIKQKLSEGLTATRVQF